MSHPRPSGTPKFRGNPPQFVGYERGDGRKGQWSKRDYEAVARVLKDCKPPTTVENKDPANVTWATVVDGMAQLFKEDNPRFDLIKFVTRIHEHEQIPLDASFVSPERVPD